MQQSCLAHKDRLAQESYLAQEATLEANCHVQAR